MTNTRRIRTAADVALGYAADPNGNGIAYASIATGSAPTVVRLTFTAPPMPGLDGRECAYAAVLAIADHLKRRGFGRVRVRLDDARAVQELGGGGTPPKALSMLYVRLRCLLNSLGSVRLEAADVADVRDLTARATAEAMLHVAA